MRRHEYPCCCTAAILTGFGRGRNVDWNASCEVTNLEQEILAEVSIFKRQGYGSVQCITNNSQKTANKILKKLGFSHSTWMKSRKHPDTKTRIWWLPLYS